ncbi:MAG: hypothetical protein GY768_28185 [Planctomycetaceae bacterium]|nr:hypothetical protein [Planctomycetaceae bacterium]
MFLQQLVHLPVMLACSSRCLLQALDVIPDPLLHEYWLASRKLTFRWCCQLRALREALADAQGIDRERIWNDSKFVLREVLIHDLTTRLFSAILEGLDEQSGTEAHSCVAQSVFCAQSDARQRTLNLLVSAEGMQLPDLNRLNEDRRQLERWSDSLLSLLPSCCPKQDYYSCVQAVDQLNSVPHFAPPESHSVVTTSLIASISAVRFQRTRNQRLHQRLSDALLSTLGAALFEGGRLPVGVFQSILNHPPRDRQLKIEQWLPRGRQLPKPGSFGVLGRF